MLSTCFPLDVAAFVLLPRSTTVEHYLTVDYPSFEIENLGSLIVTTGMVLDGMKKSAAVDGEDDVDEQMLMEVTFGDSGGVDCRNRDSFHHPDDVLDDGDCYPDDYHEPGGHGLLTFHRNGHHCYDLFRFAGDLTAETVAAVPLHWIGFDQVVFDDRSLVGDAPSLQSDDLEPRPTLVLCALPLVTCVPLADDLA